MKMKQINNLSCAKILFLLVCLLSNIRVSSSSCRRRRHCRLPKNPAKSKKYSRTDIERHISNMKTKTIVPISTKQNGRVLL